jgi:hypothetical protein
MSQGSRSEINTYVRAEGTRTTSIAMFTRQEHIYLSTSPRHFLSIPRSFKRPPKCFTREMRFSYE